MLVMQGDTSGADQALAAAQDAAGDQAGMVRLGRALVAVEAGDLDAVRELGVAGGLPQGLLLDAEVALVEGEQEEAAARLQEVQAADEAVGTLASDCLGLIGDADPMVAGLSEVSALWALGERTVAVRSITGASSGLGDDRVDRGELILLWAGRAASVGEADRRQSLLDSLIFPPDGQQWRRIATRAIMLPLKKRPACTSSTRKERSSMVWRTRGRRPRSSSPNKTPRSPRSSRAHSSRTPRRRPRRDETQRPRHRVRAQRP